MFIACPNVDSNCSKLKKFLKQNAESKNLHLCTPFWADLFLLGNLQTASGKLSRFHVPTGRSTPYIGDGHPTFTSGNPCGWVLYIHPYCWVDDHLVVYGNHGSLDQSTDGVFGGCLFRKDVPLLSLKRTAKPPKKKNRPKPKRKSIFQPCIFRGDLLASGRICFCETGWSGCGVVLCEKTQELPFEVLKSGQKPVAFTINIKHV